jgi:hypothetical protein
MTSPGQTHQGEQQIEISLAGEKSHTIKPKNQFFEENNNNQVSEPAAKKSFSSEEIRDEKDDVTSSRRTRNFPSMNTASLLRNIDMIKIKMNSDQEDGEPMRAEQVSKREELQNHCDSVSKNLRKYCACFICFNCYWAFVCLLFIIVTGINLAGENLGETNYDIYRAAKILVMAEGWTWFMTALMGIMALAKLSKHMLKMYLFGTITTAILEVFSSAFSFAVYNVFYVPRSQVIVDVLKFLIAIGIIATTIYSSINVRVRMIRLNQLRAEIEEEDRKIRNFERTLKNTGEIII